jgi:hypothetical protein
MPANTYDSLRTTTVPSSTSSVTFDLTGISGYTDLVLIAQYGSTVSEDYLLARFNGDTSTNYSTTSVFGNGSNALGGRSSNRTSLYFDWNISCENALTTNAVVSIMNYSNATTVKSILMRANRATAGSNIYTGAEAQAGLWRKTPEAITSIVLAMANGNILAGSTFSLYGIKAEVGGSTPKAIGGTVTSDATYWYHTFTTSGNFVPNQSLSCDYLVVAGGGGGGTEYGGGGGAGGYRTSIGGSTLSLTAQNYAVLIGAGGNGGAGAGTNGSNGSNSIFSSITSTGGGGGGANLSLSSPPNGVAGGSGGGGGIPNYGSGTVYGSGGAASPSGQGNAGGVGGRLGGGGGGGAGAVGANFKTPLPGTQVAANEGNGGAGLTSTISGSSVTYAGGGGGIGWTGTTIGGSGGGGNGAYVTGTPATVGTANSGGGGGGGAANGSLNGASGGSGVVIVRYLKA